MDHGYNNGASVQYCSKGIIIEQGYNNGSRV